MGKDPAILFYTADFLTGTAFFTDEQRGQYIRLLCEQHQNGHIPESHMIDVCKSLDSVVVGKFKKDKSGMYFNQRMEDERLKRVKYSESRRKNRGKKTYDTTYDTTYDGTYDKHMSLHMDNENENRNEDINGNINSFDFEKFWSLYGKPVDKQRCLKKWSKLKESDKEKIFLSLPGYVASTQEVKFRKNPLTYLNGSNWNDEIKPINENVIYHPPSPDEKPYGATTIIDGKIYERGVGWVPYNK